VIRLPDPAAHDAGVALPAIAGVAAEEKCGLKSAMESLWHECADDDDAVDPVYSAQAEVERWGFQSDRLQLQCPTPGSEVVARFKCLPTHQESDAVLHRGFCYVCIE
jgi:hypothetical protein